MISGHVFIATSLDGNVARKNHQLDWLNKQQTAGEEHGFESFMDSVDGLIMGRGSYQTVLGFSEWPYRKPVVVMSRSLQTSDIPVALRDRVRVTAESPRKVMATMEAEGWQRAYVDGGNLVQSFIREGLIKDVILTTIPILIGDGIRLFGELDGDIDLRLLSSTAFPSGLLRSHYELLHDTTTDSTSGTPD